MRVIIIVYLGKFTPTIYPIFSTPETDAVVMYSVKARHVIAQYPVTSNYSLDGLAEFLDKKSTMTEFGPLAEIRKCDLQFQLNI